ncbi:(Fe-S)-binding protein [Enterovibrio coralii]|uniref:(Fe-S)-binding protein n=2 Tax=Enterovibrio coralii TaxID=294935 RepID=A0A135I8P0_9GAMM|nr:4Fe-4S dicluster domain-containing protein [Enterovibrio coralii]KXF81788.1 (Fe-S)-binding protein [Enterovibrio coralii]
MSTAKQSIGQIVETQAADTASANGVARAEAMRRAVRVGNLIPPTVSFESRGRTLVVGSGERVSGFANQMSSEQLTQCTFLYLDDSQTPIPTITPYYSSSVRIAGFLGAFDVWVTHQLTEQSLSQIAFGGQHFDLIIDLSEDGIHDAELPPLGYYAVGRGSVSETDALEALSDTIGTFDKPKFFRLDTEKCAHFSRGLEGCTRCIDACSANALESVDNKITINPYLCQGMGSCATACPTEAISYALPEAEHIQNYLHQLLTVYLEANGQSPVVLFYAESDESELEANAGSFPENVLPVRIEELASVGIDTWFSALAFGASRVLLFETSSLHAKTRAVIDTELSAAHAFLTALGLPEDCIVLCRSDSVTQSANSGHVSNVCPDIVIAGSKRERLAAALDGLASNRNVEPQVSDVPVGTPYGRIEINTNDCTLCMGCVAVCPTDALNALGDKPGISFREQDCVQCGLCEKSCPESVITLSPGYNWDADARQTRSIIHQEAAAECISCGKPFAPASMVNMLIEKLRNHSHFQEDAIKRLSMCEDCRVRDIVTDLAKNPEKTLKL